MSIYLQPKAMVAPMNTLNYDLLLVYVIMYNIMLIRHTFSVVIITIMVALFPGSIPSFQIR